MNDRIRGIFAFNGNTEHQQFVDKLLPTLEVKYCIETGTLHGCTTAFFAERMKQVYTVEIKEETLKMTHPHLAGYTNVQITCGNSVATLPTIITEIPSDEKILFYLDAHWGDYWPLFDELDTIQGNVGSRAIIIIDDFQTPGKDYAFDSYKGVPNSWESVEPHVKKIYGSPLCEYFGGESTHELVLDESQLNDMEKKYYQVWYKGKVRKTTGKILIKEKYE